MTLSSRVAHTTVAGSADNRNSLSRGFDLSFALVLISVRRRYVNQTQNQKSEIRTRLRP